MPMGTLGCLAGCVPLGFGAYAGILRGIKLSSRALFFLYLAYS